MDTPISTGLRGDPAPLFRAVANSTKPIYQILKCISLVPKIHVRLCDDGIRFMTESSRTMQATAFLPKTLFTSYILSSSGEEDEEPVFQISFPAFLETLQILGSLDTATRSQRADHESYRSGAHNYKPDAFSHQTLGIVGSCTFTYIEHGASFDMMINEAGVLTTASLNTYLAEMPDGIPFDNDALGFRIIMGARLLSDIMSELAITRPDKLSISITRSSPYVAFSGHSDLGDTVIDFRRGRRELLETFIMSTEGNHWMQTYRFDLLSAAADAMKIATKVAFRGDEQGVLSFNFMVETSGDEGVNSFIRFDIVPFARGVDDEETDTGGEVSEEEN
jgi:cell cycle checkpoint protein